MVTKDSTSAQIRLGINLSLFLLVVLSSLTAAQLFSFSYQEFEYFQLVKVIKSMVCLVCLFYWQLVGRTLSPYQQNKRHHSWEVSALLLVHCVDGFVYFSSQQPSHWHVQAVLTLLLSSLLAISFLFKRRLNWRIDVIALGFTASIVFSLIIYAFNWNHNLHQLNEMSLLVVTVSIVSAALLSVVSLQLLISEFDLNYDLNLLPVIVGFAGLFEVFGRDGFVIWWASAGFQLLFIAVVIGAIFHLNKVSAQFLMILKDSLSKTDTVHFCGDEKGQLVYVNASFRNLFNIAESKNIEHLSHPFINHPIWPEVQASLKADGNWCGETLLKVADGKVLSVFVEFSLLSDANTSLHQVSLKNLQEQVELRKKGNVAQHKLEQLSFDLMERQEEERRHFAKELHDEIGQGLTLVKIQHQLPEPDQDLIKNVLSELIDKVRNMSLNLRPAILDDMGLAAALIWLGDRQRKFSRLIIKSDIKSDLPRFDDKIEISIFRIAQEAFTNIHKYSHAREVLFHCHLKGDYIELIIQDDGIGFDVDSKLNSAIKSQSLGLVSITERAFLINAQVDITSSPESGTRIELKVPTVWEGRDAI